MRARTSDAHIQVDEHRISPETLSRHWCEIAASALFSSSLQIVKMCMYLLRPGLTSALKCPGQICYCLWSERWPEGGGQPCLKPWLKALAVLTPELFPCRPGPCTPAVDSWKGGLLVSHLKGTLFHLGSQCSLRLRWKLNESKLLLYVVGVIISQSSHPFHSGPPHVSTWLRHSIGKTPLIWSTAPNRDKCHMFWILAGFWRACKWEDLMIKGVIS